ncbi:MAG: alpha/beta hydrolase [Patescibacteria group bacterium]|nr:alpha/beta hydrolase [Patescibacteria group bacterium]
MVHGLSGNKDVWGKIIFSFKNLFECVAITLPKRKKLTEKPSPGLGEVATWDDLDFLLEEVGKIKESLSPGELFIGMGHSRGALLILKLQQFFAEKGEKLFDKIVLITPAAPKGIKIISLPVLISLAGITPKWCFWKRPVRRSFSCAAYSVLDERMPEKDQRAIFEGFSWESGQVVAETLTSPIEIDQKKITCPVLVIAGSRDRMVPPDKVRQIAALFEKSRYREVDGPHFLLKGPAHMPLCLIIRDWIWEK